MWRSHLWNSFKRPAALRWAVVLSGLLLLVGEGVRLSLSQALVRFVYAPFFALHNRISAGADVFAENQQLHERVATLEVENQRLQEERRENTRLRRLMEFAPSWRARAIAAEVIGPLAPGSGILWVGAGSRRLVQVNWPVVTEDGLLGRVIDVSPDVSRVRTLWDPLLRVAAYDQRSRAAGIVGWESGSHLEMNYLTRAADVVPGDTIISSGWGGIFPKGLQIGVVATVDTVPAGDFLQVSVKPAVRPDRLEAVFIIRPLLDGSDAAGQGGLP
ncbi:MAG: rod shape-determining protein MreC [Candidatus Zixiibacteriota bacterium]